MYLDQPIPKLTCLPLHYIVTHYRSSLLKRCYQHQLHFYSASDTLLDASPYNSEVGPVNPVWKTQQWPQDWKRSVFIPIPKKGNAKECSNYHTIAFISHTSKAMLKILQARLQQYVNHELPDVQAGFRKGRRTRDQISIGSWKKQESSRKTPAAALLTMPKPLTMWITTNCGKF